jgi:hypothetical protein
MAKTGLTIPSSNLRFGRVRASTRIPKRTPRNRRGDSIGGRRGEADLGFGFDFTKDSNLKVLARAVGKLGAVMAPNRPLAKRPGIRRSAAKSSADSLAPYHAIGLSLKDSVSSKGLLYGSGPWALERLSRRVAARSGQPELLDGVLLRFASRRNSAKHLTGLAPLRKFIGVFSKAAASAGLLKNEFSIRGLQHN